MKLLSVIPISRGIAKESLSYFTGLELPIGSVIRVPLRKKTVPAIITSSTEVSKAKSDIKNAPFELKKVEKVKPINLLDPLYMNAVHELSDFLMASTGSVLHSLIPNTILENADKIDTSQKERKISGITEKQVIQSDDEERYATYKSLIREDFARGQSIFFCLPTIQDTKKAYEILSKGIEKYTYVLHGSISKKEIINLWKNASSDPHNVLIICTGQFLSIPRHDLGTIIIDKENSRSYKSLVRPYVDFRKFAEMLASHLKTRVIFGDILLRTETLWRHQTNELFEVTPLKFRSLSTARQQIIDLKEKLPGATNPTENREPKFKLLSDSFDELINDTKENNENMFVFIARRGLFPSTVCLDCGTMVTCHTCSAPVVLHKAPTENFFLCHRCGENRSALEKCKNCQSWRLGTFGIGIEGVEEALKEKYPELKIFKIDSDSTPTHKKSLEIIEKFYATPGSVLLGTEMSLLYLQDKIANSAVVSIDSFFSIPDFRINERVLNILLKIRSFTSRNLLIQTRDGSQKIYNYAINGNLADFYRDEIRDREMLDYPPFSILIKISLSGEKKTVVAGMEKLKEYLNPIEIDVFPAFIPMQKGRFCLHALIKIPRKDWPNDSLKEKIRNLPPQYIVNIEPESLL